MAEQNWNPEIYARNARFISDLGEPLIELLQPAPGEKVLDLGCEDGALMEKLVAAGCLVLGLMGALMEFSGLRYRWGISSAEGATI